ncbi:MAG: hypothetical protein C4575_12800 [Desulforudis sp.]|nr:MAG: hypothetical protein C4575_12800 [Desulforudis sp.]
MKRKNPMLILILIVVLYLLAIACFSDDGVLSPGGIATRSANATATYGAELFSIQLTEASKP